MFPRHLFLPRRFRAKTEDLRHDVAQVLLMMLP